MAEGDSPFGEEEEINDKTATKKVFDVGAFDWKKKFRDDAVLQLQKWASDFDVSVFALDAFVRDNIDGAISYIGRRIGSTIFEYDPIRDAMVQRPRTSQDKFSARQWQNIWEDGMSFFAQKSGLDFGKISTGSSGTRGPSGPRKPTAGEIRAMFDEDELTDSAERMWNAYLVEDAPNARSIAKGYINAVVASGGEQKLDYETFILNKIRKTNRHKLIYRNKPEGTDELQYIQPYTQAAMSVIGGGGRAGASATDVAAGGAALGASASAFSDRLARTPEHQQTTGFITGLEQRVRDIKNVLRG